MKTMRRVGLLLALVFLMPALFFSVYEISSLNKDEVMIQEIYTRQLDAILFSINQYSDDILNSWISKVERATTAADSKATEAELDKLMTFSPALSSIFIVDTISQIPAVSAFSLSDTLRQTILKKVGLALASRQQQIEQLIGYKKSGFQKTDTLTYNWYDTSPLQAVIVIIETAPGQRRLVGLLIDPDTFIQEVIGPRLQIVARDQFILSAFRKDTASPLYSTLQSDTTTVNRSLQVRNIWLFPNYQIGIRTSGSSLQEIIRERTSTNLFLLILLDVVLIGAVILVFRSVSKEVKLAQNKSEFVSNVSHEIRTPLALISMFSETLEMGRISSEEKKMEYYRIIRKETQRLTGIVNRILNFSQTEANKKKFNLETLHVNKEIKDILATYDFHLMNKGFEYEFQVDGDMRVMADREAFVESVINLIDNAMKYSTTVKRIKISLATAAGYGLVRVKDEGVGISASDMKHIFEKFYRVSSGNLAKTGGTGLGLSLVKQLMEAQQGKITVVSEVGKGSTFTLHFPLAPEL